MLTLFLFLHTHISSSGDYVVHKTQIRANAEDKKIINIYYINYILIFFSPQRLI